MRNAFIIGILSVILTAIIYHDTGQVYHNFYDDSMITARIAQNLAAHGVLSFNISERIDSASSFAFTVMLAGFYKTGLHNLELVSGTLNLLSLFFIAFFVYLSVLKITKKIWLAYPLASIASLHGLVSGWSVTGMDTTFFTALLCAFVYYTFIAKSITTSFYLILALIITRPEGLFAVPVWFYLNKKETAKLLIVFLAIICFYGFKTLYYGSPFPNSLTMKLSNVYYASDWKYVLLMWSKLAIVPVLLSVVSIFFTTRLRLLWLFILPSALACMLIHSDFLRYTSHLVPLFVILSAFALNKYKWLAPIAILIMAFQTYNSVIWIHTRLKPIAYCQELRKEAGQYLQDNLPKGTWVISSDLGAIGYVAKNMNFVDLIGLVSKSTVEEKQPKYICDTFGNKNGHIFYNHPEVAEYLKNKNSQILWMKPYTQTLSIGVVKIE